MKFTVTEFFGSAGGSKRTGLLTARITATECDTVAEARAEIEARLAPLTTKTELVSALKKLIAAGLTQADILNTLGQEEDDNGYIATARNEYVTDDVEIDDRAMLSEGDGGSWVSAWVWVSDAELEEAG